MTEDSSQFSVISYKPTIIIINHSIKRSKSKNIILKLIIALDDKAQNEIIRKYVQFALLSNVI